MNLNAARSIRLFLVDGLPSGIMIAEIINWTSKAIVVPRSALESFLSRSEAGNSGVYLLSGVDPEEPLRQIVYIGESDNVGKRLRKHDTEDTKEFFERAVVFVSKDENVTKAHARYLEARLIAMVNKADRAKLANANEATLSPLPEADRSDMEYFISQLELILPVLGLDILRLQSVHVKYGMKASNTDEDTNLLENTIFVLSENNMEAEAEEINNEFVIKCGSLARLHETPTIPSRAKLLRRQYVDDGTLVLNNELSYRFTRDVACGSPSGAAQIVYGGSVNGRTYWKVKGTAQDYGKWREQRLAAT